MAHRKANRRRGEMIHDVRRGLLVSYQSCMILSVNVEIGTVHMFYHTDSYDKPSGYWPT